ncbi:MAG: RagB/SusD family nutrient uptake outer membrane protein [Candidatus Nephrothrix sp. EaCA]|nr:MAG: RagB/SusD family nutrient uptake outer membrane protein [Candidatus Nephrothrix sp. EaCA]
MKRIIFLTSIFCVTIQSCKDVLETKPLDAFTEGAIWSNYNLAEGFIFTCYSNCIPYIFKWNGDANTKSIKNHPWGGSYINQKVEQITREHDEGWNQFENIRRVNQVLANVKKAPFAKAQKNILIGEAHFLRACIYSNLAFNFGGMQLVKNVLMTNSDFKIPRSSAKDTYDFVIADLDTAAALLGTTADKGRANKGAAYALQMRAALQAGAYLNDNAYYTKVKSAGDLLFALGGYSLDDYANMFTAYSSAVSSPENILIFEKKAVNTKFSDTPMQWLCCNTDNVASKLTAAALTKFPLKESIDGWLNYAPTQDLVDDYLVTDADGKEKKWDQTSYFTNGNSVYKKMYRFRDQRFYASIIYDSTKCFNNRVYLRADGNVSSTIPPLNGGDIVEGASQTGYLFAKYMYQQVKLWWSNPTDFCYSVLRLGEAYLNYAEAAIRLGDEGTARIYISKTYKKHGGFTNEITATGEDLLIAYKRERHVEMILETGDRYWSLLRWGMQTAGGLKAGYENSGYVIPELNGKIRSIAISADGKTYQIFETGDKAGDLKFTPKRYLYPVPYSKIQANPLLTQNAGW